MLRTRMATRDDTRRIRALYTQRFDDPPAFTDWLFTKRFSPEHSVLTEEDGTLLCAIQGWPMALRLRGVSVQALMALGVSTLPGYERRGLMHQSYRFFMEQAQRDGFPVVFNHPAKLHTYDSLDHAPVSDRLLVSRPALSEREVLFPDAGALRFASENGPLSLSPLLSDFPRSFSVGTAAPSDNDGGTLRCCKALDADTVQSLTGVYRDAFQSYSACVIRNDAATRMKMDDYAADGGLLLIKKSAYAVCFLREDRLEAEELAALDGDGYEELLTTLSHLCPLPLFVTLPPDLAGRFPGICAPKNVLALTDPAAALQTVFGKKAASLQVAVEDGLLERAALGQILCGYAPPSALAPEQVKAAPLLYARLSALDRDFPPVPCYCVDEY